MPKATTTTPDAPKALGRKTNAEKKMPKTLTRSFSMYPDKWEKLEAMKNGRPLGTFLVSVLGL